MTHANDRAARRARFVTRLLEVIEEHHGELFIQDDGLVLAEPPDLTMPPELIRELSNHHDDVTAIVTAEAIVRRAADTDTDTTA